jgi:hypothetical protein
VAGGIGDLGGAGGRDRDAQLRRDLGGYLVADGVRGFAPAGFTFVNFAVVGNAENSGLINSAIVEI